MTLEDLPAQTQAVCEFLHGNMGLDLDADAFQVSIDDNPNRKYQARFVALAGAGDLQTTQLVGSLGEFGYTTSDLVRAPGYLEWINQAAYRQEN